MPITDGHGNAKWTREESILALDLLYRHGRSISESHPDVQELSALLRRSTLHRPEKRQNSFRNPAGVEFKIQNLMSAIDPKRKLSASDVDREITAAYPEHLRDEVASIARALRVTLDLPAVQDDEIPDDEVFIEGRWLTARHRHRDRRLRKRLLFNLRHEALKCEMCDHSRPKLERDFQESLYEAHHRIPLAKAEGQRSTRVADMALLCACCHRLIHKLIAHEKRWVSVAEARAIALGEAAAGN